MIKKRNIQKGFALITVLMFAVIVLVTTGAIMLRITQASKEISARDFYDKSSGISDAILSNVIDWLNKENYDYAVKSSPNVTKTGIEYISKLYQTSETGLMQKTDTNSSSTNTKATADLSVVPSSVEVNDELGDSNSSTPIDYTKNLFLTSFMTAPGNISTIVGSGMKDLVVDMPSSVNSTDPVMQALYASPNKLTDMMYRSFMVKTDTFSQEVRVSIIPITTNINNLDEITLHGNWSGNSALVMAHTDVFKLIAKSCIPDCSTSINPRKYELIIQRPIAPHMDFNFNQAVLSDGAIDVKNAKTNSGPLYVNNTNEGDVHSNDYVAIGSTGKVGGKVTSSKLAYFGTEGNIPPANDPNVIPNSGIPAAGHPLSNTSQIFNKTDSKSNVPEIPLPKFEFGAMPTTPCNTAPVAGVVTLKDCVITDASYELAANVLTKIEGTVYFTGNFVQKGDFMATGTDPVRIIVEGTIDISGNSAAVMSTTSPMFVSNSPAQPAIKISGNPGTGTEFGAVFYTSNPDATVQVRGTADVFGSILSSGKVEFDGGMTMKRDTDLSAISNSFPPSPDDCRIEIVSWKEIKD